MYSVDDLISDIESCKGILLKEERGVGAPREYLDAVKLVVDYVASYIETKEPGFDGNWHVSIPISICSKFDMFDKLHINVEVEDIGYEANEKSGKGRVINFRFPELAIWRATKPIYVADVSIDIGAFSNGRILAKQSLSSTLIHELNHKIDEYYRTVKSKEDISNTFLQGQAYHAFEESFGKDNIFYWVIYRLFSTTELDAYISGIYGDLESLNSERENFKQDIQKTLSYRQYLVDRKHVTSLKDVSDRTWSLLLDYFRKYPILSPIPKDTHPTVPKLKQAFISKANKRLDAMLRGFGRVASYYYDMQEKTETKSEMA